MTIKIGTRKSKLALTQANLVAQQINSYFPHTECEIVPITTTGDVITDRALYDIGGKALFLKEIEQQLIENKIDIAVHSLKDVPGEIPEGLVIAAVLEREDARDVFVSIKYKSILDLPLRATIGSSSVRRKIFLQTIRPDLQVVIFRGNIDTRLKKLENGDVDGTILAAAGLNRIKAFNNEYCHLIEPSLMLPAVGQGVIAVEIREGDASMQNICDHINHKPTWQTAKVERAFLTRLHADCRTPVAAYAIWEGELIKTDFMLSDISGYNIDFHSEVCAINDASACGTRVAELMLAKQLKLSK